MKVATLLILLPAAAAASQSVNQARIDNPKLRGGVRKQIHRHEGHSLLEEFRQQRAHQEDIEDATDQEVVNDAGEQSVGPGKYFTEDDRHEKSLARKKKTRQSSVFRTSRLSRGEMEKRADEMKSKLQQVKEGSLELNEKTVERYTKFVDRYNELEKEIYLMENPEEKEEEDNANTGAAAEEKKSTSAYSSGKAEYEKSIQQMKEKKEIDVMTHLDKEASGGSGMETKVAKKAEYVYAADGSKQLKTMDDDDDDINRLENPDERGSNEIIFSKGKSSTAEDDDDDIPPNFEGLVEGKMDTNTAEKASKTVVSNGKSDDAADDDIPPNFEGLAIDGNGKGDVVSEGVNAEEEPEEKAVTTRQRGNDEIPTDIDVENSLEKVKKLADVVNTPEEVPKKSVEKASTARKDEKGDTEEAPIVVGTGNGSEDAGTEEMDKSLIPKVELETSEGQKSTERDMNADGGER